MSRQVITGTAFTSLWRYLGGGEIRGNRGRAFWRGGRGWNVSLYLEQGFWLDHATGDGGDAVDLVKAALGVGTGEALRWLEAAGFRQPSRRMTAAELAEHRRNREESERRRLAVADFRRALDAELDRAKLAAARSDDDEALERAASLQWKLTKTPEAVFNHVLEADCGRAQWLVAEGQEDRQQAARITAAIVEMLAEAQDRENAHGCAA